MKLKDGFALRVIAGENVVVPDRDDIDLRMMITLNDTGCTLWKLLEKGAELNDLTAALTSEYKVDQETAAAHAAAFVEKLRANDLLK